MNPSTMKAAVYRTPGRLEIEDVPVPVVGAGEMLVRIAACGVCGTDIKKIQHGLQPGPRIFGHEMAGTVVALGEGVTARKLGDRVALFHHVACGNCFYCQRGLHSQCEEYKRTATTAGFVPAGGGMAEYVLAGQTAVRRGMAPIPDEISFEEAALIEPVNTCLKGIRRSGCLPGDTMVIFGLGPIGLTLAALAGREGYRALGADPREERRAQAEHLIGMETADTGDEVIQGARAQTAGRGADAAIVATPSLGAIELALACVRPGGRVVLFANTYPGVSVPIDVGQLCTRDQELVGSYSSGMDLIEEAASILFNREVPVAEFITHRFPLTAAGTAIDLAAAAGPGVLKVMILSHQA